MENVADYKEIVDVIKESGGDAFKRCFQCGLCDTVCPWNRVRNFSMRKLVWGHGDVVSLLTSRRESNI